MIQPIEPPELAQNQRTVSAGGAAFLESFLTWAVEGDLEAAIAAPYAQRMRGGAAVLAPGAKDGASNGRPDHAVRQMNGSTPTSDRRAPATGASSSGVPVDAPSASARASDAEVTPRPAGSAHARESSAPAAVAASVDEAPESAQAARTPLDEAASGDGAMIRAAPPQRSAAAASEAHAHATASQVMNAGFAVAAMTALVRAAGAVMERAAVTASAVARIGAVSAKSAPTRTGSAAQAGARMPRTPLAVQIGQAIASATRLKSGVLVMKLDPDRLGAIEVRVKIQGSRVAADIRAATAAAREMLEQNLDALRSALERRGFEVQSLAVPSSARQSGVNPRDIESHEEEPERGLGDSPGDSVIPVWARALRVELTK